MEALVLGDLGFLGRHFAAELRKRGWTVHGTDTKRTSSQDCRNFFRYEIDHPHDSHRWDLVIHAAAVIGGRSVIDGDPLATAVNLAIDAEMFRWAAVTRPRRVVYFSSSAAYPVDHQDGTLPTNLYEDLLDFKYGGARTPDQVYGWSKVIGEMLSHRLRAGGVPVTVVRPFSGYGDDQDEDYPFRAILERVRRREDPLTVWSDTVRDFVHVDDIVNATLEMADREISGPVNLCTGRATRFSELARMMADVAGYSPEIKVLSGQPTGVAYRVGDPALMNTICPARITLEEAIHQAFAED